MTLTCFYSHPFKFIIKTTETEEPYRNLIITLPFVLLYTFAAMCWGEGGVAEWELVLFGSRGKEI